MVPFRRGALFMAPMVDLSHVAYRQLIRSFGGCDLFYSEMLNSRIVPNEKPGTSIYLRWASLDDLVFQILGSDPEKMARAAAKLEGYGPKGIDVNMGCWLHKVMEHGWGAALMKDVNRSREVLLAVRRAVPGRPVSAKLRIGHSLDKQFLLDFAAMIEGCGADFLVLHARTVSDGMNRKARWEYIAAVKDSVSIPVVGNGDVACAEDALAMMRQTGCDGVMIGRQAVIQPWIFRDIRALASGGDIPDPPDLDRVMLDLLDLLVRHFPPDVALKRFKTAVTWMGKNLIFGHHLSRETGRAKDITQVRQVITDNFKKGIY
ncbi:MAG: tRNA-dihydrouridine synthase family protein [Deltaproteobacteria bacterium]|nr:tRNA-dihydrouridine synthase family protein [Deltaproteobacteria bacterium]